METSTWFAPLRGIAVLASLLVGAPAATSSPTTLAADGEWNFRVLFRSILSQQGGGRRDRYAHIAAQIEPEEGRILEPERARRYLENYFSKGADISLYWGSPVEFIKELLDHWDGNSH